MRFGGRHARKIDWVGNPLRDAIAAVPPPDARFAVATGPLRLLVVGGSLGAAGVERARAGGARAAAAATRGRSVVHQAGERHIDALRAAYATTGVDAECVPFIDDMAARYAWADLVVCRGGAITVAELAAVGLGSIIVPLPGAIADEQIGERAVPGRRRRGDVIPQAELTGPSPLAGIRSGHSRERVR